MPSLVSVVLSTSADGGPLLRHVGRVRAALGELEHEFLLCGAPRSAHAELRALGVREVQLDDPHERADAYRAGVALARGDVVVLLGPDLDEPVEALPAMVRELRDAELDVLVVAREARGLAERALALLAPHLPAELGGPFCAARRAFLGEAGLGGARAHDLGFELATRARLRGRAIRRQRLAAPAPPGKPRFRAARARAALRSQRKPLALFALVGLCAALAGLLVARYGTNVPRWDEWVNAPVLAGHRPVTLEWLWSAHLMHRFPLPRLLSLFVVQSCGGDLRAGMMLNVAALVAATCAFLWAARRARGAWSWSDALFPLALLHWGHTDNILWSFQLGFVLTALLFGALCLLVCRPARRVGVGWVSAVVLVLLLLPLVGGAGFLLAAGMTPWLLLVGATSLARRAERAAGAVALGGALALVALLGAYATGLESAVTRTSARELGPVLRSAAKFLSNGLGPVGAPWHPVSTAITGLATLATGALLARRAWRARDARAPAAGLLCLLLALLLVALGVGWGRQGRDEDIAFSLRYVTLAAPLWCLLQLAWSSALAGGRAGRRITAAIALLFAAALPGNELRGLARSAEVFGRLRAFELDAWSGTSAAELARRHAGLVHPSEEYLAPRIKRMQRAGVAPFDRPLEERWPELRAEYARYFYEHRSAPWLPVLIEDEANHARIALLAPAPASLAFRVPAGRWRARGVLGMRQDAWTTGGSDGVEFRVELERARGRPKVLLRRLLDPLGVRADRAPQAFEVEFEVQADTTVLFVTDRGPSGDGSCDWSYWSDLALVPNGER
jgi:hypothetical protein